MARPSSRSKPRRLGIPSRKSVSAAACNASMRAFALVSCILSRRISAFASLSAGDRATGAALALAFFFIAFPQSADFGFETAPQPALILTPPASSSPRRLARPHQDRIVHCRSLTSAVDLTFAPAEPRVVRCECQIQNRTGIYRSASVPLVLPFVNELASAGYECQSRDTSL